MKDIATTRGAFPMFVPQDYTQKGVLQDADVCRSLALRPTIEDEKKELSNWVTDSWVGPQYSVRHNCGLEVEAPEYESVRKQTFQLMCALGVVLRLHHCPRELRVMMYQGLSRYLLQSTTEKEWVNLAKYVLTYPIARYLKCEEPPRPKTGLGLVFRKRFHRWIEKRYQKFSKKNTWFFSSWLQAKRACLPLNDDQILLNFLKHRDQMNLIDPLSDDGTLDLDDLIPPDSNIRQLLDEVSKKIKRVYYNQLSPVSRNACIESNRASGGQRKGIIRKAFTDANGDNRMLSDYRYIPYSCRELETIYDHYEFNEAVLYGGAHGSDLVSMGFHPRAINPITRVAGVFECHGLPIQDLIEDEVFRNNDYSPHIRSYEVITDPEYPSNVVEFQQRNLPTCEAAGVLEPLKVRMISKGECKLYYYCKALQETMHSVLKSYDLFKLIGRPQCPTDLIDIVPDDIEHYEEPLWLSGDYSAATDCLSARLSSYLMEEITKGIPPKDRMLALRALGSHYVTYPQLYHSRGGVHQLNVNYLLKMTGKKTLEELPISYEFQQGLVEYSEEVDPDTGDPKPIRYGDDCTIIDVEVDPTVQTNGQLMGSIMSFPILCLANAVVLDRHQRETLPYRLPYEKFLKSGRINGDDLLTIVDGKKNFLSFARVAGQVGFHMTQGKSYYHKSYANINSAPYHYDLERLKQYKRGLSVSSDEGTSFRQPGRYDLPHPESIEFFNTGLYTENHKVMSKVGGESTNSHFSTRRHKFTNEVADTYDFEVNLPKGALKLKRRLQRKGVNFPDPDHRNVSAIANRILEGTPQHARLSVWRDLCKRIHDYGEDILFYRTTTQRGSKWKWMRKNHFLPISVGGLGIQRYPELRYKISAKQRKLGRMLHTIMMIESPLARSLPLPGPTNCQISLSTPFQEESKECDIPLVSKHNNFSLDDYSDRFDPNEPLIPFGGIRVIGEGCVVDMNLSTGDSMINYYLC